MKPDLLEDRGFSLEVTRKEIKHFYLRVDPKKGVVRVSAPRWANDEDVEKVLYQKSSWLEKKLKEAPNETAFNVFGEPALLIYEVGGSSAYAEGILSIGIRDDSDEEKDRKRKRYLKKLLQEKVQALLEDIEEEQGLSVDGVSIKDMSTRWGSINVRTKKMNLSLRLIHKKPWVIKAVILHEMAHLKYPHHKQSFYSYLGTLCPCYEQAKRELRST